MNTSGLEGYIFAEQTLKTKAGMFVDKDRELQLNNALFVKHFYSLEEHVARGDGIVSVLMTEEEFGEKLAKYLPNTFKDKHEAIDNISHVIDQPINLGFASMSFVELRNPKKHEVRYVLKIVKEDQPLIW